MSKPTSLASQSAWILTAKTIGFALNIALPLITVRFLKQDDFGVYRQVFLVSANAVSILPLGFSMSAYYFLNRESEKRPFTIFNVLLFNFTMGGLAFLVLTFAPKTLGILFQNDRMTELAPLVGIAVWLLIFSSLLEIIPLANQEARLASGLILFTQLTKMIFMVASVIAFGTVEALIYASIIHASLQTLALILYLKSRFRNFWLSIDWNFFRQQLAYALPFGIAALVYTGQRDVHNYFVSNNYSPAEFAVYSVGCFQLPLIWILYESIVSVMIPKLSQMQSGGKKQEMLLMTTNAMRKLALIYFPMFFFLEIVADVFITTLFTEDYSESVPIFRINLILLPFFCVMMDPIGRAFKEVGRYFLIVRIIVLIALISVLWFATGEIGLSGIISVVVAAILIELTLTARRTMKMLGFERRDMSLLGGIGRTGLAAGAAACILFVFYLIFRDTLLLFLVESSQWALSFAGLEKGAELFGGCLFLGMCLVVYASVYIVIANRLNVIDVEDKRRLADLFARIVPSRFA